MANAGVRGHCIGLVWMGMLLTLAPMPVAASRPTADVVVRPLETEAVSSPSGAYWLELDLRPHANTHVARATARLVQVMGANRHTVWERALAHRSRPRFLMVSDAGQVVLLDEWLNVRSERAVMVIDPQGHTRAQHNLDAVRAALDVPLSALTANARHGPWIQAPPRLDVAGTAVEVATANRTLLISLSDGALSAR